MTDIRQFMKELAEEKPLFYAVFCEDSELRPIYINKFAAAHGGVPTYRDTLDLGKQPRMIGKKPVYIVVDWEPGRKNPKPSYAKTKVPVMLLYTSGKPTQAQSDAYNNKVTEVPNITGSQVTSLLTREGLPEDVIAYLKEKTDTNQEAVLVGKQVAELSAELELDVAECFRTYFLKGLQSRNIDEEPTEFLHSIFQGNGDVCFSYIQSQQGNEFFVFAALLNYIEDIIKFCSCNGDYWNSAGLVAAKYNFFKSANVGRIPYVKWVKLYEDGLDILQSIKINQPSPSACLEVFVCRIIRTLM